MFSLNYLKLDSNFLKQSGAFVCGVTAAGLVFFAARRAGHTPGPLHHAPASYNEHPNPIKNMGDSWDECAEGWEDQPGVKDYAEQAFSSLQAAVALSPDYAVLDFGMLKRPTLIAIY